MDNRDGFDIQKLDREVDELLSDVKNLLNENAEPVNESGGEDAADGEGLFVQILLLQNILDDPLGVIGIVDGEVLVKANAVNVPPQDADAMSDATVVYKPLTYYEQSKPAYQTARRAQYEREREQQRQERERLRLEREAEEERKMQELEQWKKNPRRRTRPEPPADEQDYAKWLYEQGNGEETVYQREQVAIRVRAGCGTATRKRLPPEKKRKRHPVRGLLLVLLTMVVASAAALLILARQPESENALGARRKGCSTILLAGTDQDGYRTDTMMLLSVDRENGKLSLVSIPRDTLVFCEYSVPKINSAYGWAGGGESGMKELMQRVTEIIGFEPDGYVLIDLAGFEKLIDCMGGVEFNVPMDMQYSDPTQGLRIDLKAGEQKLNGDEAMQLVRFRSGYAMADLDRVSVGVRFRRAQPVAHAGKARPAARCAQDAFPVYGQQSDGGELSLAGGGRGGLRYDGHPHADASGHGDKSGRRLLLCAGRCGRCGDGQCLLQSL